MDKDILSAIVGRNKPEPLVLIEKLNRTCRHVILVSWAALRNTEHIGHERHAQPDISGGQSGTTIHRAGFRLDAPGPTKGVGNARWIEVDDGG
ncbi:hypothetical protein ASE37_22415 [Rhizobium sp. Root268]|nr:hypothetical protein ASC86_23845 [Rhizobium sp. Root1212]KRD34561.1 hypothetical protein ASE37_22415 [Rhizobium sp. Root268]